VESDMNDVNRFKSVESNASKGDIQSLYQLYLNEYGEHKEDVNYNYEFLQVISDRANSSDFILKETIFNDFRGLNELTLRFDEQLTVLIGSNGIGKSSILDGIAVTLSWLKSNILREDRPGKEIKVTDINNEAGYASVTSRINFSSSMFTVMIANSKPGSKEKKNNELFDIKSLAGIYRHSNDYDSLINLPLISYYSINRSGIEFVNYKSKLKYVVNKSNEKWSKLGAYEETGINRQDFDGFIEWLKFIFLSSRDSSSEDKFVKINKLESEIRGAIDVIDKLPDGFINIIEPLKNEILLKRKEIQELRNELGLSNQEYAYRLLNGIKLAFLTFVPNLDDVNFRFIKEDIIVEFVKKNIRLLPSQLSQGEKTLLALIGDIAKRLVLLNPSLDNPLSGKGIVLIDEIDLHLHPGWQQIIIGNLLKTFPNIQFVISTHSPQVLTTVPKKSIRILKEKINERTGTRELTAFPPSFQTKGVMSADVLSIIMGIDPTPPVEEADWLDRYKELIEIGAYKTESAIELKKKLVSHFGNDHPLMIECDNIITLQEIKRKIAEKKNKD
jgi:predicted ATP-binding protein involved in virulence